MHQLQKILVEKFNSQRESLISIEYMNEGFCNDLWKVTLKDQKVIIKKYNIENKKKYIHSINLQIYMNQIGLSPYIAELKLQGYEKEYFSIQDYVESKEPPQSGFYYQIGVNLGLMHINLKKFETYSSKIIFSKNKIETFYKILNSTNGITKEARKLVQLKIKILNKYLDIVLNDEDENIQLIHGDYSYGNIIYNSKIWNIDFDETRIQYRCFEVAKFIVNILQKYNCETARNYIKDFLIGYKNIAKLSMDEINKMFYVYAVSLANDESGISDIRQFKNYSNYQKYRIIQHEFILESLEEIKNITEQVIKN